MYKIYSLISITCIWLSMKNKGAWNVYERAGFMHTATKEEGPIGKERILFGLRFKTCVFTTINGK